MVGRRGIFYTMIAVVMALLVLLIVTLGQERQSMQAPLGVEARIMAMHLLISDLEQDLERVAQISGYRGLLAILNSVLESGEYVTNFEMLSYEAFQNGTLQGRPSEILYNQSFSDWALRVSELAGRQGFNLSVNLNTLKYQMASPWDVLVSVNASLALYDASTRVSWRTSFASSANISIIGLEDPVYPLTSYGRVLNTIRRTPYSSFVVNGNTSNLQSHIQGGYYLASPLAPDFLMRLQGNFSPSPNGIESIFYLPEFTVQEVPIHGGSCVDYLYAQKSNGTSYRINNTWEAWLRIDAPHLAIYGLEGLAKP